MAEEMRDAPHYYDWIYETVRPHLGRSLLELGPGFGAFAERAIKDRKNYAAVDVDSDVIERLRERLKLPRRGAFVTDASQPEFARRMAEAGVDTLVSMNVLEHVEDDEAFLRGFIDCAPKGTLILLVPAIPLLYGRMDREAGHFRRYRRAELESLLARAGLKLISLNYFNALGALTWFISSKILDLPLRGDKTNRLVRLYDGWAVPAARCLDPLFNRLAGQSLLAVARIP